MKKKHHDNKQIRSFRPSRLAALHCVPTVASYLPMPSTKLAGLLTTRHGLCANDPCPTHATRSNHSDRATGLSEAYK